MKWIKDNELIKDDISNQICSFYQRFLYRIKKEEEDAKITQIVNYSLKLNRKYYLKSSHFIEYASKIWILNDKFRSACKRFGYKEVSKKLSSVYGFITNRLKERGYSQNDLMSK